MIKNVVLDMGNVLLDFDPEVPLDLFCGSQEEKDVIRRELFQGPEWRMGDLGQIRDGDRYRLIKDRVPGRYWPALRRCCEEWDVCMNPLPGAEEFCRFVRDSGYGVYILSNASDAFYRYFPAFLPLSFFDGVVVSADIHMLKPNREIYEYLLSRYGLTAEECLFIDDRQDNVDGARAAGLQAYRFQNDYKAVKALF